MIYSYVPKTFNDRKEIPKHKTETVFSIDVLLKLFINSDEKDASKRKDDGKIIVTIVCPTIT